MDLSSYVITPNTDPALLPFIRAWKQSTQPTRTLREVREDNEVASPYFKKENVMENLCRQCGIDMKQYIKEKRELLGVDETKEDEVIQVF